MILRGIERKRAKLDLRAAELANQLAESQIADATSPEARRERFLKNAMTVELGRAQRLQNQAAESGAGVDLDTKKADLADKIFKNAQAQKDADYKNRFEDGVKGTRIRRFNLETDALKEDIDSSRAQRDDRRSELGLRRDDLAQRGYMHKDEMGLKQRELDNLILDSERKYALEGLGMANDSRYAPNARRRAELLRELGHEGLAQDAHPEYAQSPKRLDLMKRLDMGYDDDGRLNNGLPMSRLSNLDEDSVRLAERTGQFPKSIDERFLGAMDDLDTEFGEDPIPGIPSDRRALYRRVMGAHRNSRRILSE